MLQYLSFINSLVNFVKLIVDTLCDWMGRWNIAQSARILLKWDATRLKWLRLNLDPKERGYHTNSGVFGRIASLTVKRVCLSGRDRMELPDVWDWFVGERGLKRWRMKEIVLNLYQVPWSDNDRYLWCIGWTSRTNHRTRSTRTR